jgi:hypothetical protein
VPLRNDGTADESISDYRLRDEPRRTVARRVRRIAPANRCAGRDAAKCDAAKPRSATHSSRKAAVSVPPLEGRTEELVPDRNEMPLRIVPRLLWVSVVLLAAFVAFGIYSQSIHETTRGFALLSRWEGSIYRGYAFRMLAWSGFEAIMGSVPVLSGLVMLWISFLSPRWSDRMSWSAAMIFTAYELALDATYFFPHNASGEVYRSYPRVSAVVGLIAYGSWLLIIPVSTLPTWLKRLLSSVCVLALMAIVLYPAIDAYTRAVDTLGSILFAGALFALGVFVAGRVGVNLLRRGKVDA